MCACVDRAYIILIWKKFIYLLPVFERERRKKWMASLDSLMDCACNVWRGHNAVSLRCLIIRSHMQSARLSIFTSLDRMLNGLPARYVCTVRDASHTLFSILRVRGGYDWSGVHTLLEYLHRI